MSSRVNLNDNISDRYEFSIGGLDYDFKYPTLSDVEPITELYNQREKVESSDAADKEQKLAEIDNLLTDKLYGFIIPIGHSIPIKETLSKQSIRVVKEFNKMLTDQLSGM